MYPDISPKDHHSLLRPRQAAVHRRSSKDDSPVRRWFNVATRPWRRRRMIAALEALDTRLLNDIGLRREEIRRIVHSFDERELGMAPLASSSPGASAPDPAPYRKAA